MGTYSKDGKISSHFDKERHEKYDPLGRKNAKIFFESKGFELKPNDKDVNGKTMYDKTDLLAIKTSDKNIKIPIECSVKSTNLWKYIFEGVDVELRKAKYGQKGYICMSNDEGTQILIIALMYVDLAIKSCGEEYAGGRGIENSPGFVMPEHGCHRVRKRCYKGLKQSGTEEDFVRIPYKYVYHFKKHGKNYKIHSKPKSNLSIKNYL